jgi:hypothetical protein
MVTTAEFDDTAQSVARELLSLPESICKSQLDRIRSESPTFAAMVDGKVKELRDAVGAGLAP